MFEEILRLLFDSQRLATDEPARATSLRTEEVRKAIDVLAMADFLELKEDKDTIDPALERYY